MKGCSVSSAGYQGVQTKAIRKYYHIVRKTDKMSMSDNVKGWQNCEASGITTQCHGDCE